MSHTLLKHIPATELVKIRGERGHVWQIETTKRIVCTRCGCEHWQYQQKQHICIRRKH